MTTLELLSYLRTRGVRLWAENNRLRYKAPEGVITSAIRSELVNRREEILTLVTTPTDAPQASPPLRSYAHPERAPLSFAQQRLWFLSQLEATGSAYNCADAVQFSGNLDISLLQQSFKEIIRRHAILRTTIVIEDDIPYQHIASEMDPPLPVIDLQSLPAIERDAEVQRLATQEAACLFDLAHGPCTRTHLLRLAHDEHVLLLTIHHVIADGWSIGIFAREMAVLYTAFCAHQPSPLPPLPLQYTDFADWQRQWLRGERLERQVNYWKKQLADISPILELPTDYPRPPMQALRGSWEQVKIPPELSMAIKLLSQQERTTLFMTLLAAFQILLYRYSWQEDIVVGSPIAGRTLRETEGLIGCFVNTLALRSRFTESKSFRDLLNQVRETTLNAYAHQDLPFEKLVEELHCERSLSYSPIFQVVFALQNTPAISLTMPGLRISPRIVEGQTTKFDLTLLLSENGECIEGIMEYREDLFRATTIQRMLRHYLTLLEDIVAHPDRQVKELRLLPQEEREQLLTTWNRTQMTYPQNNSILALFEAQATRSPDAVAISHGDSQLSYGALNSRANQLAHYLRTLEVGPEVPVGICMERSLSLVIGLLGILKAGGAYVPLDPTYPQERLAFMLRDSRTSVLLTQEHLQVVLPVSAARLVCLDTDWQAIAHENAMNPELRLSPLNLAYVVYTSGSTGHPKGVQIMHQGLLNLVYWHQHTFAIAATDRASQITSPAFDATGWELWPYLTAGASVCLVDAEIRVVPSLLQDWLLLHDITIAFLPTALAEAIMSLEWPPVSTLRYLLTGADTLHHYPSLVQPFPLVNNYGPTETTVVATYGQITADLIHADVLPPIGHPIANAQIYLLDKAGQPTPIGVAGELSIGGAGLARGYLNRPELTAERFVPHPFSNEPGARLYRTGDLARYRENGEIEFLGRLDRQVKLRGYRIELDEIVVALQSHPCIQDATVILREDQPGEKRLVAYCVLKQGEQDAAISELRSHLSRILPDYMLPSVFIPLSKLPYSPNGKIDLQKLLVSKAQTGGNLNGYVAPRDALELQLVRLFENILKTHPVGIRDNFFALGGHSFLAIRLIARIRQQFGQTLSVSTLFQRGTVEHLASVLSRSQKIDGWSPTVTLQARSERERPLFCLSPIQRDALCYMALARQLDQCVIGLQAPSAIGENADQSLYVEEIAGYYISALRSMQPYGPYWLCGWSSGGVVAFEIARQLLNQNEQIGLLALLDSHAHLYFHSHGLADIDETESMLQFIKGLLQQDGQDKLIASETFQRKETLFSTLHQAKDAGVLPPDIEIPDLRLLVETTRAGLSALEKYTPEILPCQITLFRAREGQFDQAGDVTLGWQQYTTEPVEIFEVPGHHYTMLKDPHVSLLAQLLQASLKKSQQARVRKG